MRITIDLSPWVHHHAGLGRYAGELITELQRLAPQNEYVGLYHAAREIRMNGALPGIQTVRVPLDAKPWRMSVLLAYYAGMNMDGWLPATRLFHATDHLLPPFKNSATVFTLHDLIFRFFPQYHLPLNRWFLDLMLPRFLRRADAIIVVSENTKRDAVRLMGIPPEKMTVIYEGVNPTFHPIDDPTEFERVRAEYKLPHRFILFFSTIEPRKNLVTLLDAYAELLQQDVSTPPLVVMGRKGWLYQETLAHISVLGLSERVILTDWVRDYDVPAIINLAEVFVFPSLYEGFGLTPLEAMACGTPVISSNASSLPEVIGDAGILIEPRDSAGFAEAMRRVLSDESLQRALRGKGLKQAGRFTWERTARETLRVYERVVEN
jgi:glycosyltransferase involved in cell wall biosynthesis